MEPHQIKDRLNNFKSALEEILAYCRGADPDDPQVQAIQYAAQAALRYDANFQED